MKTPLIFGLAAVMASVALAAADDTSPSLSSQTKTSLLEAVDSSWSTEVTPLVERVAQTPGPTADIVLEDLAFVHAPLSSVLEEVVEQVQERSGKSMSYLVMGSLDPEVSLSLKKVLLSDALDLLSESTAMTCEKRASMIIFRPAGLTGVLRSQSFPMSASLLTRLVGSSSVKMAAGSRNESDLNLATYDREAAQNALREFFERLGIVWDSGTGMALADGELWVTHNTSTLRRIEDIFENMAAHRQVEIEARFMEVKEGTLNELGVQWNIANASGNKAAGTSGVTADSSNTLRNLSEVFSSSAAGATSSSTTTATAPTIPGSVNLANTTSALVDVTGFADGVSFQGVLRALSQQEGSELLSAPRVTVLSGSTANITVAQELRYPQSYDRVNTDVGSGTTSGSILTAPTPLDFTTRNVGVEMQVTPYVEDDGSITLILEPKVTKFERFIDYGGQSVVINGDTTETLPSGFFQPVFSVRKLTTEVNLPSGSTVLLGGLTNEESVRTDDKVPLLGDIPFIGRAFRSSGNSVQKKNLVIFVTARLIEPQR